MPALRSTDGRQRPGALEVQAEHSVFLGRLPEPAGGILVVSQRQLLKRGAALCRDEAPRMFLLLG